MIVNDTSNTFFPLSCIFISVQLLSRVWLFVTPWIAAHQASLSITSYRSSLRLTSIESVMPSSHLILCHPLLLLLPIPPSIRVFSSEPTLHMRWPKYWSFSFSIIPSKEIPGLISFRKDLQSKGLSRVFSNTTVQSINSLALSLLYGLAFTFIHDYWKNHSFDTWIFVLDVKVKVWSCTGTEGHKVPWTSPVLLHRYIFQVP